MTSPNKKTKLTEIQKAFVVQRLACFDSPKEAAEALMEEHGVKLAPQNIEAYDPHKRAGRNVAQKWRELFEKTRQDFQNNLENYVPEANKTVRIRQLANSARALKARGNHVGMADMLERIAKELGNVHTNKRELSGKDGGPIQFADMTEEQLNARLATLMNALGEGGGDDAASDD